MPTDPTIITALETALAGDPENCALRMHLVPLLLDAERAEDALEHCTFVLSKQPDHLDALTHAARAAQATGDGGRAEGYRRLHEALSGGVKTPEANSEHSITPSVPKPETEVVRLRLFADGSDYEDFEAEKPQITLADVAGMEEVKRRLNIAFLAPLRNPEVMKMYGKSLRGGLLLYGPPGCGKTFIARAVAGELSARFISVGLSEILDMYIGQSERNLHAIFETARRNSPCVLFFDEIDALGRKRSLMRESGGRNVVNQLLAELDSIDANNEGLFVLAATNHPWDVDAALRRPGRLDRTLLVLPPDRAAREAILRSSLRGRPVDELDFDGIAARTERFSGADIVHLCDTAAEFAMEDSLTSGVARPISHQDFAQAMKEVRGSILPWFEVARNYAQFANEGGVYDDLLKYLRASNLL